MGIHGHALFDVLQSHGLEHGRSPFARLGASTQAMHQQRLHDLPPNLHVGIQRGHGVLKNHRDAVAPYVAQGRRAGPQQIGIPEDGLAGFYLCGRHRQQSEHGVEGDRLAAARFAHDAQGLAALNGEGDAVHGASDAVARMKPDA